ncbi:MAG: hypothetical protein K6E35_07760 [Bacteroidales bacterium]|nr:hypothetical protein [Bacteroidales bacterium]
MMGARERFIKDTLESEGRRLIKNQGLAAARAYQRGTGRLVSGRTTSVSSQGDGDGKLTVTHPIYERFLDIRYRHRKGMRLHNHFVFGAYASIAARLMYGFTEEVAASFRELER